MKNSNPPPEHANSTDPNTFIFRGVKISRAGQAPAHHLPVGRVSRFQYNFYDNGQIVRAKMVEILKTCRRRRLQISPPTRSKTTKQVEIHCFTATKHNFTVAIPTNN